MKKINQIDCIFEKVYVETPVDTDGDGKLDLIAVYITRPISTLHGERIPAVYVANPYMMTCNDDGYKPHDVNCEVKLYPQQNITKEEITYDFTRDFSCEAKFPRVTAGFAETAETEKIDLDCISELYGYLNQKGYASVFSGGLGTLGSEGFTLTGSQEEILAFKSVIDWLNGSCRAFTNKSDNIEIKASWCTGNVAMSAKSYLGTMCIGVAATGVEGLKTIIPEAGISNWYNYYRCNGLNLPALDWQGDDLDTLAKYCFSREKDPSEDKDLIDRYYRTVEQTLTAAQDRDSGNYNRFWDERNYLNGIDNFKASVFIIHGLNDWNVKTNQCCPLFRLLEEKGIERKMLLHQGEHIYVYDLEGSGTLEMIERWLDHYLKGVDNGIEKEAKVLVESNLDQLKWMSSDTWPPSGWEYVKYPVPQAGEAVIIDDLSATVYDKEKDNQKEWLSELVLSEKETYRNRLKLLWDPFEAYAKGQTELRLSGTIQLAFDARLDKGTAILSAMLVDLGEDKRISAEEIKLDDDGTFKFGLEAEASPFRVISRGWLNAQNRTSLWSKETLTVGESYHYQFEMVPTDYTVKAGHKLALIIYGIDAQETQRPDTVTSITLDLASLDVKLPFVKA